MTGFGIFVWEWPPDDHIDSFDLFCKGSVGGKSDMGYNNHHIRLLSQFLDVFLSRFYRSRKNLSLATFRG